MPFTVVEYIREDGSNPYRAWFDGLDPQAAAKIVTAVMRLRLGNTSNLRGIGTITEYRINWGPGYRIYLAEDGNAWVLLGGGTKRRHRAEIEQAKARSAEYNRRKSGRRSGECKR